MRSTRKQRRAPVGREQDRGPGLEREQRLEDPLLGAGVDARERVVEQQHRPLERQRPRQRHALLLAARERDAALAEHGVEPLRELVEVGPEAGAAARPARQVRRRASVAVVESERDVLADRLREEERLLRHDAEAAAIARRGASAPPGRRRASTVPSVGLVEPRDQVEQRRLPRAGAPHDRDRLRRAERRGRRRRSTRRSVPG